jgi:TPR repeat protein
MYVDGLGGLPKNDVEAVRRLIRAAEQGDDAAELSLALLCQRGAGGLPKSDADALRWCKKAARDGSARAQEYLRSRGLSW